MANVSALSLISLGNLPNSLCDRRGLLTRPWVLLALPELQVQQEQPERQVLQPGHSS
jgi:hypothetical protein